MVDENKLEQEVKNILDNGDDDDITVELSNLSERSYRRLRDKFSENYQVKGTVNILRIGESGDTKKGRDYILYISKRYENA